MSVWRDTVQTNRSERTVYSVCALLFNAPGTFRLNPPYRPRSVTSLARRQWVPDIKKRILWRPASTLLHALLWLCTSVVFNSLPQLVKSALTLKIADDILVEEFQLKPWSQLRAARNDPLFCCFAVALLQANRCPVTLQRQLLELLVACCRRFGLSSS